MEEKKEKKKVNKFYIVIITLAIISFILGVWDMKANAAEYLSVDIHLQRTLYNNGVEENTSINKSVTLTSESPIYLYLYNQIEPISGNYEISAFGISKTNISGTSNPCRTFVDNNGVTWYCVYDLGIGGGLSSPYSASFLWTQTGAEDVFYFNCTYSYDEFVSAFSSGTLDLVIDYDSLVTDDDLPIITDLLKNEVVNTCEIAEYPYFETDRYDYLTWTNNGDYKLQIEFMPIVQYYDGTINRGALKKEYKGDWVKREILDVGASSYLQIKNITKVDSEILEFWNSIVEKYPASWNETANYFIGYRIRYIDSDSEKAGKWVYCMPSSNYEEYVAYNQYSDETFSDAEIVDGTLGEYTNIENIEDALVDVDNENEFKEKYETVDNDVDVQEATNWLKTVVNFISGTPSVIGSVLGFLPQPILYGMYVCIWLGVIASGVAIVRALI